MNDEKMPTVYVRDLKQGMMNWKIKFTVLDKSHEKEAKKSPTKFQTLTLADSMGDRIHGVIFGADIQRLKHTLAPLRNYYIGNAVVKEALPQYRSPATDCELRISKRTVIKQCVDDANVPNDLYHFTPFTDFNKLVDSEASVDIIGLVLAVGDPHPVNSARRPAMVQDIVIIDESLIPISLSLWDEFIDNEGEDIANAKLNTNQFTVIMAQKVKVSSYAGMTLSTKPISTINIDPPIERANVLLNWSIENVERIDAALKLFENTPWEKRIPMFTLDIATDLKDIQAKAQRLVNIWVYATLRITSTRQKFFYMSCECGAATDAEYLTEYECNSCHANTTAKPRAFFDVTMSDDTSHETATIDGELAEKTFSCTAQNIMEKLMEGIKVNKDMIDLGVIGPYLMHLKASDDTKQYQQIPHRQNNNTRKKFKIQYIQPVTPAIEATSSNQESLLRIDSSSANSPKSSGVKRKLVLENSSEKGSRKSLTIEDPLPLNQNAIKASASTAPATQKAKLKAHVISFADDN